MALPGLPEALWLDSFDAAWMAAAAVVAAYRPRDRALGAPVAPVAPATTDAEQAWERAVADGGDHIVKFADTALGAWERTADPATLSAIDTAIRLRA
jgi:hypothetical protein